jgi:hypothetical protein
MTLAQIFALMAGIVLEILLLWEQSNRARAKPALAGLLSPRVSRLQELMVFFAGGAWLVILLTDLFFPQPNPIVADFLSNLTMGISFFFLFAFGMVMPTLMPRITEQTVITVTLVAGIGLYTSGNLPGGWMLSLLAIPTLGVLALAFTVRVIPTLLKSLFYFWYLICLLTITAQQNFDLFFSPSYDAMAPLEYFIGGAAGIFLLLHAIFIVRFFLMLTAYIIPAHRTLMTVAMPQFFSDEQISLPRFLLVLTALAVLSLANQFYEFASPQVLTSLLALIATHGLNLFPTPQK